MAHVRKTYMNPVLMLVLLATLGASAPPTQPVVVATGVAEDATASNSQPKVARDRDGTLYITFVKPVEGKDQVFLASSTDHGHQWQLTAVTRNTAGSRYPTLAIGPEGIVHVAWTQYDGGVGSVYYARFDGRSWSALTRVSEGTAYAGIPALTIGARGQPHMVWYGIRAQAPSVATRHGSIYEILYSTAPGKQWTPAVIISPGVPDSINPTLGIDSMGRLHSAWYQYNLRTYQVRHTTFAQSWSPPVQVSQGEDASTVAMALGPTDAVYLVWERHEPSGTRIYFAERTHEWNAQQPVSAAGEQASNPSIAVDPHGTPYVAWANAGTIYLRRRGGPWLGIERLQVEGHNDHPILSTSGPEVYLTWTQQLGKDRRLMFASVRAGGMITSRRQPTIWIGVLSSIAGLLALALWQWWRRRRQRAHVRRA